jgi:hypothetical protein
MPEAQPISYVLLDEGTGGQVQVIRKNRDQFFLSLGEAVAVCAAFVMSRADFVSQMSDLLDKLSEWVRIRGDKIKSAFFTVRPDNSALFVVTQREVPFDATLSDELTDLDIEIANSEAYSLINLDVLAIPAVSRDSANAFLSSGRVFTHA